MTLREFITKNNFETSDFIMFEATSPNGRIEISIPNGYNYVEIKIDNVSIIDKDTIIDPLDCKIDSIKDKLEEAL